MYAEDILHMLFKCPRSMLVWEGLGLVEVVNSAVRMDQSGSLVLEELLCSPRPGGVTYDMEHRAEIVMIACWYLWWSRRRIKNKEPVPTPERTIINIQGILANSVKLRGIGKEWVDEAGYWSV
jgi:hypothetical protein